MNSMGLGDEWENYKKVVPKYFPFSFKIG